MISALRNTAPILLVLGAFAAAASSTACGSSPDSGAGAPAGSDDTTTGTASVVGTYQAEGAGAIQYVQFEDASRYVMLREGDGHSGTTENGTYTFDAGRENVTFSPDGAAAYTVPFAITSLKQPDGQAATGQALTQSHPLGAGIVGSAGLSGSQSTLNGQASRLNIGGSSVQLASGVMGYCPDGSHIPFPTLETGLIGLQGSNCAFKDGSGAIMTSSGKVVRS